MVADAQALVVEGMVIARRAARKYSRTNPEPYEDLLSDALLGLWKAATRYDATAGVPFAAFAWKMCVWSIQQGKRDRSYLNRTQQQAGEWGRLPISLQSALAEDLCLEDVLADPNDDIDDLLNQATRDSRLDWLHRQVLCLPTIRHVRVIKAVLRGETLAEISRREGVTESRVSQIHTQAVRLLRERAEGMSA